MVGMIRLGRKATKEGRAGCGGWIDLLRRWLSREKDSVVDDWDGGVDKCAPREVCQMVGRRGDPGCVWLLPRSFWSEDAPTKVGS